MAIHYHDQTLDARWYSSLRRSRSGRCYIVLSGPSVETIREPRRLGRHPSFWVNGSPGLACRVGVTPSYYVVSDIGYIRRQMGGFINYSSEAGAVITHFGAVAEAMKRGVIDGNFYLYDSPKAPFRRGRPEVGGGGVTRNGLAEGNSVAIGCLHAAMEMGFSEIFVFGLDLGGAVRFYAEANPEPSFLDRDFTRIFEELAVVAEVAGTRGVRIVNCSLTSRLAGSLFPVADPNDALECTDWLLPAPHYLRSTHSGLA